MYGGSGANYQQAAMYDRGDMDEEREHKTHMGSACVMMIGGAAFLTAYSYWLEQANGNENSGTMCCAWYEDGGWDYGQCGT